MFELMNAFGNLCSVIEIWSMEILCVEIHVLVFYWTCLFCFLYIQATMSTFFLFRFWYDVGNSDLMFEFCGDWENVLCCLIWCSLIWSSRNDVLFSYYYTLLNLLKWINFVTMFVSDSGLY